MYIECLWLLWVIAHCSFTEMTVYCNSLAISFCSPIPSTDLLAGDFLEQFIHHWPKAVLYASNVDVWNVIYDVPIFLEIWRDVRFVINSLWVCLNVCLLRCLRWKHILEEWYFSCLVDIGLSWASNRHLSAINWQINDILGNAWSRCLLRLTPKPAENDGDALLMPYLSVNYCFFPHTADFKMPLCQLWLLSFASYSSSQGEFTGLKIQI